MAENRDRHRSHVLAAHVVAAVQHGPRLGAEDEILSRSRPRAPGQPLVHERRRVLRVVTGRSHKPDRVVDHVIRHGHAPDDLLDREDVLPAEDRLQFGVAVDGRGLDDLVLFRFARIVDKDIEHEPVELRLGQRIRALLFDRVLRREHEERKVEIVIASAGRHLVFLHRLQQRGLRLRRRPVDLVGEDDVAKDWPLDEAEGPLAGRHVLFDDVGAGDVRRHEVGRELDASELEVQDAGDRADEERLGEAGHADQQAVAAGEHRDQHLLDHVVLPDDDLVDLADEHVAGAAQLFDGVGVVGSGFWVGHGPPYPLMILIVIRRTRGGPLTP